MALGVGQERGDAGVETGVSREFRMQGTSSWTHLSIRATES